MADNGTGIIFYIISKVFGENRQRQAVAFVWLMFFTLSIGGVLCFISFPQEEGLGTFSIITLFFLLLVGVVQLRAWSSEPGKEMKRERVPEVVAAPMGGLAGLIGSIITSIGGFWLILFMPEIDKIIRNFPAYFYDSNIEFIFQFSSLCCAVTAFVGIVVGFFSGRYALKHGRSPLLYGALSGAIVGVILAVINVFVFAFALI